MSMFEDYEAEAAFARDFPHGVPSDEWTTRGGTKIKLTDMTESYIHNCMKIIGEDDPWYCEFQKELERRKRKRKTQEDIQIKAYKQGYFDALAEIASVWYGRQCYFAEPNGTIYSRISYKALANADEAMQEFLDYISEE